MTDFFDRVERELDTAATRLHAGTGTGAVPARRRGRLAAWFASHSLLALLGGALLVGGAGATTAAVVSTIHGTPSAPTHGVVPKVAGVKGGGHETYRIAVMPQLLVGQVGWCEAFGAGDHDDGPRFGSYGCGPAPVSDSHVFYGNAGGSRRAFQYRIVDATVAYVETANGRRFLPRRDPAIPNDWRAIVILPGQVPNDHMRFRDAAGRPVRPLLHAVPAQPIAASHGAVAAGQVCGIALPADRFDPRGSHWVTRLGPVRGMNGAGFMPCAQTAYRVDDAWAEVTVLVDGATGGAAVAPAFAGARPSPHARGVVELPAIGAFYVGSGHGPVNAGDQGSAKRVGKAWVVVRARSRALRERVLRAVTVTAPGG
ncbi:MAG: hypothetical protein AAGC46_01995 [Solirubrobacteraceae bacterium]